MSSKNHTVYKITNLITQKIYFGVTKRTIKQRLKDHSTAPTHMGNSIRKYGILNFLIESIYVELTEDEAYKIEENIVTEDFYKLKTNYNAIKGGKGVGGGYSDEIIKNKCLTTMRNDIDEFGLNGIERRSLKAKETMLNDIDINGLNTYQRIGVKSSKTLRNRINSEGKNGIEVRTEKAKATLSKVDKDGLSGYDKQQIKALNTRKEIQENGKTINQNSSDKRDATMSELDENGKSKFQLSTESMVKSKRKRYATYIIKYKDSIIYKGLNQKEVKKFNCGLMNTNSEAFLGKQKKSKEKLIQTKKEYMLGWYIEKE